MRGGLTLDEGIYIAQIVAQSGMFVINIMLIKTTNSHPQYWKMLGMKCNHLKQVILEQVLVGQKVDDTICWINLYSVGSTEH